MVGGDKKTGLKKFSLSPRLSPNLQNNFVRAFYGRERFVAPEPSLGNKSSAK